MANDKLILGNSLQDTGDLASWDMVTHAVVATKANDNTSFYSGTFDSPQSLMLQSPVAGANSWVPGIPLDANGSGIWSHTQDGGLFDLVNPTTLAITSYNVTNIINTASPAVAHPPSGAAQNINNQCFSGPITQAQSDGTTATITGPNNFPGGNTVNLGLTNATWLNGSHVVATAGASSWTFNDTSGHGAFGPTADSGTAQGAASSCQPPFGFTNYHAANDTLITSYEFVGSPIFLITNLTTSPVVTELDFDASLWTAGSGSGFGQNGLNAWNAVLDTDGLTGWALEYFGSGFARFNLTPTNFTLTSVATSVGSTAVYTGTITGGAANAFAGFYFTVTGFTTGANNISYAAKCTASSATTLTLTNSSAVAETHAATATYFITHQDAAFNTPGHTLWYTHEDGTQTFVQDDAGHYYVPILQTGAPGPTNATLYKAHVVGTGGTSTLWNGYMNDDGTLDLSPWLTSFNTMEGSNNPIAPASDGVRYLVFAGGTPEMFGIANVDSMVYDGFYPDSGSNGAWTVIQDKNGVFWMLAGEMPRIGGVVNQFQVSSNVLTVSFSQPWTQFTPFTFQVGETVQISASSSDTALNTAINAQKFFVLTNATQSGTTYTISANFTHADDIVAGTGIGSVFSNSTQIVEWSPLNGWNAPREVVNITSVSNVNNNVTFGGVTYICADYNGTVVNGGNTYAGTYVLVKGSENGTFLCVANDNTKLTLANPSATAGSVTSTAATGNPAGTIHTIFSTALPSNPFGFSNSMTFMQYAPATSGGGGSAFSFSPNPFAFGWT